MHYVFIGGNQQLKDEKISALRKKILPSIDSQKLDCDVMYAHKLSAEELKKSLISLPAVSPQRVVVIRNAEKLKQQHKDLLLEFLESEQEKTIIVLEATWGAKDKFLRQISKFIKVEEFALAAGENIFAVTRMMTMNQSASALKILHKILDDGQHPLQVMGGLVWFWGNKVRARVSKDKFEKGLLYLQEADLNIKRSKLSPNYALEVLIAKLSVLLNG